MASWTQRFDYLMHFLAMNWERNTIGSSLTFYPVRYFLEAMKPKTKGRKNT